MADNDRNKDSLKGIGAICKNVGFSGLGEISTYIFSFITVLIITRIVGAKIYGIFLLANTVVSILMLFSLFGLGNGVVRYVSFYNAKKDPSRIKGTIVSALITVLLLSLFFFFVTFFLADAIAIHIFHNTQVAFAIKVLIFSLPFLVMTRVLTSAIHGFQDIKDLVIVQHILKPISRLIVLVILFCIGLRLMGILLASVFSSIILTVLAYHFLKKIFSVTNPYIKSIFQTKELINFSWPLLLVGFLSQVVHWTDVLMLGFFLSAKEVGIYGVVLKMAPFIILPLKAFNTVFAPLISDLYTKGDLLSLEKYFKLITKWIFTVSFPLFIVLVLFYEPILIIFGDEFALGAIPLIVLCFGQLINASTGSSGNILVMTGRPKLSLMNFTIIAGQNIIFNYLLIPKYGLVGAALASSFSFILINFLRVVENYYFLRIHPYSLKMLKPFFGGMICLFIFYVLRDRFFNLIHQNGFSIIIPCLLFFLTYCTLLFLFKLDVEDKLVLKKILQRVVIK